MSQNKITIEIPKDFLLTIAVYGNMGDGKLPKIMQTWAQGELRKAGLVQEFNDLQAAHLRELETRLRNVIGDQAIDQIHTEIKRVVDKLKSP